jgi:N-acetylglucosaminyldiphosphoundecaprenol N-acetyl-beta-D-mannosaminyltransferase
VAVARRRLRIGSVWVDVLTRPEMLEELSALVDARNGGTVFTPNVDHVVLAERNTAFRHAYARASLTLADGAPLLWASRLLGIRLPEKLSGSDMVMPIAALAGIRGWRVYLLGGRPGAAEETARQFRELHGVEVVGVEAPRIDLADEAGDPAIIERIRRSRADLVFVALGAPKQELWSERVRARVQPAVLVSVGASFEFIAGQVPRAPAWLSRIGGEWLFRLAQEPRRLWRRYLVDDPRFVGIVLRTAMLPKGARWQARARPVEHAPHVS